MSANLRLAYVRALFAQPVKTVDQISAGTIANTITSSANTIQLSISDKLHLLFSSLALTIAAYVIAFKYSWALTLVTSSAILFVIVVYSITTPIIIKLSQKIEVADAKAASIAGEVFGSIRTALSLGAEDQLRKKYFQSVDVAQTAGLRTSRQYGFQLAPIFFAMYSSFALAFWYGIKLYRDHHITDVSTVIM